MTPTQEGLPALATDAEIAELWQIVAEVEVDTDIGVPSSLIAGFLARLATAERQAKELRATIDACHWYWPEDDTSSDACSDGPHDILDNAGWGEVVAISRGGVVETRFYAQLPPASDATSDDNFEVDEATYSKAKLKIAAEQTRRAALEAKP